MSFVKLNRSAHYCPVEGLTKSSKVFCDKLQSKMGVSALNFRPLIPYQIRASLEG